MNRPFARARAGAQDLTGGQWGYFRRALIGPLILVMIRFPLAELICLASPSTGRSRVWRFNSLLVWPAHDLLTVLAAIWLGLAFSLRCRSAGARLAWTVGLMVGTEWLWTFVFRLPMSIVGKHVGIITGPLPRQIDSHPVAIIKAQVKATVGFLRGQQPRLLAGHPAVAAAILAAVEGGILPPGRSRPGFRLLPGFSPRPHWRGLLSAGQDARTLRQARTPAATSDAPLPRHTVSRVFNPHAFTPTFAAGRMPAATDPFDR